MKDFGKDLLSTLPNSRDSASIEALLADLNHNIHTANALPLKTTSLSSQTAKSLKDCGRKLWNECIKERRKKDNGSAPGRAKLLVRTRVFAFLIHALARESHQGKRKRDDEEEVVYLMHLALTVGRLCVEESDLDGARLGLHKVADYIEQLKSMDRNSHDDPSLRSRFEAEYLTMRTALVGLTLSFTDSTDNWTVVEGGPTRCS